MTPRSVQIWFQNRRQRLLKPSLRGEGGEGAGGEELGDIDDAAATSPTSAGASLAGLSQQRPWESGAGDSNQHAQGSSMAGGLGGAGGVGAQHSPNIQPSTASHCQLGAPQTSSPQSSPQGGHSPRDNLASVSAASPSSHPLPPQHSLAGLPASGTQPLLVGQGSPSSQQQSALQHLHQLQQQTQPSIAPPHPYPVTAAHLVHAFAPLLRGEQQSSLNGGGGIGAHPSLPLLVSSLGSLMMGTASVGADPATGLPNALALLPQAVAAGQVSPGAAALLMQALQQRMSTGAPLYSSSVAAAPSPSAPASNNSGAPQAAPSAAACAISQAMAMSSTTQPTSSTAGSGSGAPPPTNPRLPAHLGGPALTAAPPPYQPHMSSHTTRWPAALPDESKGASSPMNRSSAPLAHPYQGVTRTGGTVPQRTCESGVDALLLLSACADMQKAAGTSDDEQSSDERSDERKSTWKQPPACAPPPPSSLPVSMLSMGNLLLNRVDSDITQLGSAASSVHSGRSGSMDSNQASIDGSLQAANSAGSMHSNSDGSASHGNLEAVLAPTVSRDEGLSTSQQRAPFCTDGPPRRAADDLSTDERLDPEPLELSEEQGQQQRRQHQQPPHPVVA